MVYSDILFRSNRRNFMKPLFFPLTFFVLLSAGGCIPYPPKPHQPHPDNKTISDPLPMSEIPFTGLPAFDNVLSEAMQGQTGQIEVSLTKSVDPDQGEMPPQLSKWLAAIEDNGGEILYEPLVDEMNLAGDDIANTLRNYSLQALNAIRQWWYKEYQEEQPKYQWAKNYNARLCYRRNENLVTKIVFVARSKMDPKKAFCPREGN
jgi:hypothetical protein